MSPTLNALYNLNNPIARLPVYRNSTISTIVKNVFSYHSDDRSKQRPQHSTSMKLQPWSALEVAVVVFPFEAASTRLVPLSSTLLQTHSINPLSRSLSLYNIELRLLNWAKSKTINMKRWTPMEWSCWMRRELCWKKHELGAEMAERLESKCDSWKLNVACVIEPCLTTMREAWRCWDGVPVWTQPSSTVGDRKKGRLKWKWENNYTTVVDL